MPVFTSSELDAFERNGFVVARKLVTHDRYENLKAVAQRQLAAQIGPMEYEAQVKYPGSPPSAQAPGGSIVRRLLQASARDPLFREWATSSAIGARLHQLLGSDVELSQAHHNCVMTKNPAFSSATGWHQDIRYWSFQKPEL
ncbi:MAG: phytanoyl-CoA dioxygenase family protein, partial [Betaproteobacteria bacterium]